MGLGGIAAALAVACLAVSAQPVTGSARMVGPSHVDPNFPTVNAVSGTPDEWMTAVCTPRLPDVTGATDRISGPGVRFLYPNDLFELPGSTFSALCSAKGGAAYDPIVLVAQYPSEDPMQRDLLTNAFTWYCFAAVRQRLLVVATRAEEHVTDASGWGSSPVLEPLSSYGFNVYGNPGH